jgi:hypothetical protein
MINERDDYDKARHSSMPGVSFLVGKLKEPQVCFITRMVCDFSTGGKARAPHELLDREYHRWIFPFALLLLLRLFHGLFSCVVLFHQSQQRLLLGELVALPIHYPIEMMSIALLILFIVIRTTWRSLQISQLHQWMILYKKTVRDSCPGAAEGHIQSDKTIINQNNVSARSLRCQWYK